MEDVEFNRSHSNSPLPEAGNDPGDPLRPEIDEENSTPNPPIADPNQDMEVVEGKEEMPDEDDLQEAALSDNESALSDLDDAQFEHFDAENLDITETPAYIDENAVKKIGVHKRKRTEGEEEGAKKKKKKVRREKPRRKRGDEDEVEGGAEVTGERRSRKKKEARVRGLTPPDPEEDESLLTPEERRRRALDRAMDEMVKKGGTRRKRRDGIDLDQMADQEIEDMRRRMTAAAQADNEGREKGEPAQYKLKLLPEVVALLNKNTLKDSVVDPEINLLEAVRFFLEPLNDGSLPAYNIQRELFAALGKLPINKESLVASGIGKVIMFYVKSKRPEPMIKRQAEKLFNEWTRPILRRTDDFRKKEFTHAEYDPNKQLPVRPAGSQSSQAIAAMRAKAAKEPPPIWQRARMEQGPSTYTIVPKSSVQMTEPTRRPGAGADDLFRRMRAKQLKGRSGR